MAGKMSGLLHEYAKAINPQYRKTVEAKQLADIWGEISTGTNIYKNPMETVDRMLRSGNPVLQSTGLNAISQYHSNKPKEVKTFDYVEKLTPEERLRWVQQNPSLAENELHTTYKGEDGNMVGVFKNGKELSLGKYREDPRLYSSAGALYDQYGTPVVNPEEVARNKAQQEAAVVDARLRTDAATNKDIDQPFEQVKVNKLRSKVGHVQSAIVEAIEQTNLISAGLFATEFPLPMGMGTASLQNLGGSPQNALATQLDTIKASLGFDELQAIRDASKTGGALGQVTERELDLLQASVAKLDQRLNPVQLKRQLRKVMDHYTNVLRMAEELYKFKYNEQAGAIGPDPHARTPTQ